MGSVNKELELPSGFLTVKQVQTLSSREVESHRLISVIGLVKDFQSPIKTKGSDWKCTLEITDHSIQPNSSGIKVVLFWPLENMPSESAVADIAIISRAKLQGFGGLRSLLSNINTTVHIMPSRKIPRNQCQSYTHLWKSCSYYHSHSSKKIDAPSCSETKYALMVNLKKSSFLTSSSKEFSVIKSQANNAREKFKLVADARSGEFCDLVGKVVKMWRQSSGALSLYISDYSANKYLYDYAQEDTRTQTKSLEEEYYPNKSSRDTSYWPGPHGKLTIQIALWDENADYVNERVKCGDWLALNNVHMKLSPNGSILEGAVHSDNGKVLVQSITTAEKSPAILARLKSAMKRESNWLKNNHSRRVASNQKTVKENNLDNKRKYDNTEVPESNSIDAENKIGRHADLKRIKIGTGLPGLNNNIKSKYPSKTAVTLREILNLTFSFPTESNLIPSPFTNRKYKAIVRVIDYFPDQIEHFAVSLDDDEIDEPLGSSSSEVSSKRPRNHWEWRFALLLEEASVPENSRKECLWVVVDNYEAQHLLNLEEDATDLSQDKNLLALLKEQLFKLWGDLEEKKSAILQKRRSCNQKIASISQPNIVCHSPGMQPDPDSDGEKEKSINQTKMINSLPLASNRNMPLNMKPIEYLTLSSHRKPFYDIRPSNKAFTCCIQQYGIKEIKNDSVNSNLEPKILWKRQYAIFGTKIA